MTKFQPMLSATIEDTASLKYPLWASPKLDGIRCVKANGKGLTRNLKPVPNTYIRAGLENQIADHPFDGELMIPAANFNQIQSIVMSHDKVDPSWIYCVFDLIIPGVEFEGRQEALRQIVARDSSARLRLVEQIMMFNEQDLLAYEAKCLAQGYEGVMVRGLKSNYKFGRSTLKQQWLCKLKRFKSDEAVIIGMTERMHNANELEEDALGHAKRSSMQSGMIGTRSLGAMLVRWQGKTFNIGTGFDEAQRIDYWAMQTELLGLTVTFKYQELSEYGIPRFPVFLGFRKD